MFDDITEPPETEPAATEPLESETPSNETEPPPSETEPPETDVTQTAEPDSSSDEEDGLQTTPPPTTGRGSGGIQPFNTTETNGLYVNVAVNDQGNGNFHVNAYMSNLLDVEVTDWKIRFKTGLNAKTGEYYSEGIMLTVNDGSITVTPAADYKSILPYASHNIWFYVTNTDILEETSLSYQLEDGTWHTVFGEDGEEDETGYSFDFEGLMLMLDEKFGKVTDNQQAVLVELQTANEALAVQNEVFSYFFIAFIFLLACKFVHFLFFKVFFGGLT